MAHDNKIGVPSKDPYNFDRAKYLCNFPTVQF